MPEKQVRRVIIRNTKSAKEVKPRLFDALVDGDRILLEVKSSKRESEVIPLSEVLRQIRSATQEQP